MAHFHPLPPTSRWFALERVDDVTVLRFTRPDMRDGEAATALGAHMLGLADEPGRRFVLDFGGVGRVSSAVMGKLITFHKKVKKGGGRLALCALGPDLHVQFERTRLNTFFHICPTEEEALQGVQD